MMIPQFHRHWDLPHRRLNLRMVHEYDDSGYDQGGTS